MNGPRVLMAAGNIAFTSGKRGQLLPIPKVGLGYAALLHVSGTMQFVQPAGAAAPSFTAGGPWNLLQLAQMSVNGLAYNCQISGRGLMIATALTNRAAVPYTAPIPGANSGTSSVTTNEAWSWNVTLPIATSERDHTDPVGLVNFQNQAVTAYMSAQWASESTILNLPNSQTASFTGSVEVREVLFDAPGSAAELNAILPLLTQLHTWEEVPAVIASGTANPRILLPVGEIYSRIVVMVSYNGAPDLSNQAGLNEIRLSYGQVYPIDDSAQSIQYMANQYYYGNIPGDCYLLDFSRNLPSEVLDATTLPQLNLDLIFDSAPANTTVTLLLERYKPA